MLVAPALVPAEAHILRISPEKEIHFFAMIPLYPEEYQRAREMAAQMLLMALKGRVTEVIDLNRRNYGELPVFMTEMIPAREAPGEAP